MHIFHNWFTTQNARTLYTKKRIPNSEYFLYRMFLKRKQLCTLCGRQRVQITYLGEEVVHRNSPVRKSIWNLIRPIYCINWHTVKNELDACDILEADDIDYEKVKKWL